MGENDDSYRTFLDKVGTGANLSEAEWLFHFDHQNADARDGLAVGAATTDFALVDHTGRLRTRSDLNGDAGLLMVFARSADW
jgi:hypothetical protein